MSCGIPSTDYLGMTESYRLDNCVEFCSRHLAKTLEVVCNECRIPLCSKCITSDHRGHSFRDLDNENQSKIISEINRLLEEKEELRSILKSNQGKVRNHVKKVEEQANNILEIFNQIRTERVNMLYGLSAEITGEISKVEISIEQLKQCVESNKKAGRINTVKKEEESKYYDFQDCNDLFKNCSFPIKSECETALKHLLGVSCLDKKIEGIKKISQYIKTRKISEIKITEINSIFHISKMSTGAHLVSDEKGKLLMVDERGNSTKCLRTSPSPFGYFTGALNEDAFYFIDSNSNKVNKIVSDRSPIHVINIPNVWTPRCINITKKKEIIVGMENVKNRCKVSIYNSKGKKIHDILTNPKTDNFIFSQIIYVCENVNGDICASQCQSSVISVTRDGEINFTYPGCTSQSTFHPGGICSDKQGNIFVCNTAAENRGIHLINLEGRFLRFILKHEQCPSIPLSVCYENSKLYVGWYNNNTVTCYNYN